MAAEMPSREFEQVIMKHRLIIKDNKTNCRVSFIDFYSVFPTNFRAVFLPHTNTVIFMKP